MAIKITCDSTCDLTPELIAQYDITILPLYVSLGQDTYQDGVTVQPPDLFAYVDRTGTLPSTAAVNVADYQACFSKFSPEYDAVIHITIGSEFSCCYQNASLAAEDFDNVYVVNSQSLSSGHGYVVIEACLAARRGDSAQDILRQLDDLIPRIDGSFIVDRLDYLVKGGRCSSAAALGANLLKLKPCIELEDGKMHVGKKYRGSFEKVLQDYTKERLSGRDDLALDRVFLVHTTCREETVAAVRQAIVQYAPFAEIIETIAGSTISCHCGPNTLGLMFARKK